jgi:hypothetical protein
VQDLATYLSLSGGVVPAPYAEHYRDLQLCKLYSCTPSQLDEEPLWRVTLHQAIQGAVDSWNRYEDKSAARKARRQRQ